jgi:phage terminase large subunit-like protein
MPDWRKLRAGIERLERRREDRRSDRGQWDWYAEGCPCGLSAGECREHPRARANQRPPGGAWRTWLLLMGRGAGKTRAAAEWVRRRVESGAARRLALVGATAADVRDTMVDGESGLLAISPPWFRPRYEPTKRRLTWPNGARATTFSADEPDRLRGPQHDAAWLDELAAFRYPAALDNLLFGLRLGADPRLCITTTPRPVRLVVDLIEDPTTAVVRGTTYDNRNHLAASFFERIVTKYEGTRLGQQELLAEVLEVSDGVWFPRFAPEKHVVEAAEYDPRFPVHLAIDCGVSRHTAAVWFQVRGVDPAQRRVTVFGDFHAEGLYSEAAAKAIWSRGRELPHHGSEATVRLDPASSARTGIGPAAYAEFERVFGARATAQWPKHRVADGLDQLDLLLDKGLLLIHPRCVKLKAAFQNYRRKRTGRGDWLDEPEDPQHPHEDLIDALRGGVRDRFPEGRIEQPALRYVHASRIV